jgi:hypothetical protein
VGPLLQDFLKKDILEGSQRRGDLSMVGDARSGSRRAERQVVVFANGAIKGIHLAGMSGT